MFNDIQETINRTEKCLYFFDTVDKVEKATKLQVSRLKDVTENLAGNTKDLNTALEYYKQGVDIVYQKTVKSLEIQLTELMQEVFSGCEYGISFEIEDLRGAKNLIIEFISNSFKGEPDDFGGSLETVVGYLFHLMYLIKSGRPKILLLDEVFRDVNNEYLFNLIELINRITKSTDFVNILITHVEEIQAMTEKVYTVTKGNYESNISQI